LRGLVIVYSLQEYKFAIVLGSLVSIDFAFENEEIWVVGHIFLKKPIKQCDLATQLYHHFHVFIIIIIHSMEKLMWCVLLKHIATFAYNYGSTNLYSYVYIHMLFLTVLFQKQKLKCLGLLQHEMNQILRLLLWHNYITRVNSHKKKFELFILSFALPVLLLGNKLWKIFWLD